MTERGYELHTLGWQNFEDLVTVILQEVMVQTAHKFADGPDGGRDAAFHVAWRGSDPGSLAAQPLLPGVTGQVAVQCKFVGSASGNLGKSAIQGELPKVARLHNEGLCDAYLLFSNLPLAAGVEGWFKAECAKLGVEHCEILDGQWIAQEIRKNPVLRRYVPRVYGLGDLAMILDDRLIEQGRALLQSLQYDLGTFVVTAAYEQALTALESESFVLLLGEPASGKSTMAATLSMTALDVWGCDVMRVDSAEELLSHWDAHAANQVFWVDDAFGAIRHEPALTDEWARRLRQVMAAISGGARVIMTSRDYIYRQARIHLKEYCYPLLREEQVVIDLAALTQNERRKILYNHLKAGDQPKDALDRWKPNLAEVADVQPFYPEVARRLASRSFTAGLELSSDDELIDFFEHPAHYLVDVMRQLDPASTAALAAIYLSEDGLIAPANLNPRALEAVRRLGSTEAELLRALDHLDGTYVARRADGHGEIVWRFRHPTLREGFAVLIASDVNHLPIYLDGLTDAELLRAVDCGGDNSQGTLVHVPPSLYDMVIPRVDVPNNFDHRWFSPIAVFLTKQCSDEFLQQWSERHVQSLPTLLHFGAYIGAHWQPGVLGRLHQANALPEDTRRAAVQRLTDLASSDLDYGWLTPPVVDLFTEAERQGLVNLIRSEIVPNLSEYIDSSADGYTPGDEPPARERYRQASDAVRAYLNLFASEPAVVDSLQDAEAYIEAEIFREEINEPKPTAPKPVARPAATATLPDFRDPFDDVSDGHA